jgi:hypothetical protein
VVTADEDSERPVGMLSPFDVLHVLQGDRAAVAV